MKKFTLKLFIINILFLIFNASFANQANDTINKDTKTYKIYKFDIKEEIAPPVWRKTKKAFAQANDIKADIILIYMNTYGGLLDVADSIRSKILRSTIPVYVFINNNAASAGALISIACDSIYMCKGANIGAATVVNQKSEALPDKYQSYMRSMMRSTAQAKGRDPDIAQAMVDPRIYIKNITDSGRVITFTSSEAIKYGFCQGQAESIKDVFKLAGIKNYEITEQKLTSIDKFIGFLISPVIKGILIMLIIGGIYFEMQSPGIGFPLALAITGALFYFAPLYIEGLATNWEILVFVAGLILIALEIFVIPGFGIAGISGIILVIIGLTLSMINNIGFDFTYVPLSSITKAFFIVIIAIFLSIISSIYFSKKLLTSAKFKNLALNTIQKSDHGYTIAEKSMQNVVGKTGIAMTILHPVGKIEIDSDIYFATAETGYIEKGEKIKVIKYNNAQLIVEKYNSSEAEL